MFEEQKVLVFIGFVNYANVSSFRFTIFFPGHHLGFHGGITGNVAWHKVDTLLRRFVVFLFSMHGPSREESH